MVTEEIIKYANEQLRAGHSADAIKNAIVSAGYTEEEANSALASAKAAVTPRPSAPPMKEGFEKTEERKVLQVPVSFKIQTVAIPFDPKGSRIEFLFIRWLWSIFCTLFFIFSAFISVLFLIPYAILASVLNLVNFFSIMILGRRLGFAFNAMAIFMDRAVTLEARLLNYHLKRGPYFNLLTDKRPDKFGMEKEVDREETGTLA